RVSQLLYCPLPPRPPTSTLFPYTTLFRSSLKGQASAAQLLGPMMTRGAGKLSRQQLQDELDKLGARLNVVSGTGHVTCNVETKRSEEHTSELQSRFDLVCRLLLEKKKKKQ